MKNFFVLILFLLISMRIFAGSDSLGPQVALIEGKAFLINLKSGEKKPLKVGDRLGVGFALKTEGSSKVLLQLSDATKKLVPANTTLRFMDQSYWERYKKTSQSANKIFTLIGRKAANEDKDLKKREAVMKMIQQKFNQKEYDQVIDMIEKNQINLAHPNEICIGAISYLQMGLEEKSLAFFNQLIEYNTYEYRELSRFGAFLCYFRLNQKEKAENIYKNFNPESPMKEEMKGLLEKKPEL